MKPRLRILTAAWALVAIAGQAFAANAVRLAHTFTPGEVLRYRVTANITLGGGSIGSTDGILAMRTVRILPNGDAHVSLSYESGKASNMEKSLAIPADHPAMEFDLSPNGTIREVEKVADDEATKLKYAHELDGGESVPITIDIYGPMILALYNALPPHPVAVGESWKTQLPEKNERPFVVQSKLVSTKAGPDGHLVATIRSIADLGAMKLNKTAKQSQSIVSRFSIAPGHLVGYDQTMTMTDKGMSMKLMVKLTLLPTQSQK